MGVQSSFVRSVTNVSGDLENYAVVYDQAANAVATVTPTKKMQGISMSNYSDNYAKSVITLTDATGVDVPHALLLLPNSTEAYNFEGRFIKSVTLQAVAEPVTVGVTPATGMVASATASAGLVDVNLIEA